MKRLLCVPLLCSVLVWAPSFSAHGGSYRGPGDTLPPGGGGAGSPGGGVTGPTGPSVPGRATTPSRGGPAPTGPGVPTGGPVQGTVTGAGELERDLTQWIYWWEFNKEPYLALKARIHADLPSTGDESWFLGGKQPAHGGDRFKPSQREVYEEVVPALLDVLGKESDNHIVTGCLMALAKIGDAPSEDDHSLLAPVIGRYLADANQEIRETAAVALGILAHRSSVDTLAALLLDTEDGQRLVQANHVDDRTRAFAAYGLGLIGARVSDEAVRRAIVVLLQRAMDDDRTKTRDLGVACVIAQGLVPLDADAGSSARIEQLDRLLAFLQGEQQNHLVRAHCPAAMARLLVGLTGEEHEAQRQRLAEALIGRLQARKEKDEVVQSSVQALGLLGTWDGAHPLDVRIRAALMAAQREAGSAQARLYALIALAKVGGRPGASPDAAGRSEVQQFLLSRLADGRGPTRPWAGLACGVLGHELLGRDAAAASLSELQGAVRRSLAEESNPEIVGAFAIAAGLLEDREAAAKLVERLHEDKSDDALGYVSLGLGLMGARDAAPEIERVLAEAKYRPELLKQAAIALGLLGDKNVVPLLVDQLAASKSLATQASVSSALGFIGDRRSLAPLERMLRDTERTESARGFAAVALGVVADKELLPWNSKIALDLNYRASTPTLVEPASGTGILDIL